VSGHTLYTEIEIAAPPPRVWEVLTDLERWSEWNHLLTLELRGPLQEATQGRLTLSLPMPPLLRPPLERARIPVRLVTVRRERELAWQGGIPRVMVGCHGFRLEPTSIGTRVVHTETFRGLLAGLFVRLAEQQMYPQYRKLNEALRTACERD